MSSLPEALRNPPPAAGYCVAYSGGLDSTVLLHLARVARLPNLFALHVHHGLQAVADDWARHCELRCAEWGVPFKVLRVAVDADHPQGPEAAAREARYAALSAALPEGALLLTAHHARDQAETVLLRLLRGTGVAGLAAMPPMGHTPQGRMLWRPLLATPREALIDYAQREGLRWLDDPHNADPRYSRSWLRAEVMPLLRERWPAVDAQLARTARLAAETASLLDTLADERLSPLRLASGALSVPGLLALPAAERALVLRRWLHQLALPMPYADTLERLESEVLRAAPDAEPLLCWPGAECRRYRDALFAGPPLPELPEDLTLDWDGREQLQLPQGLGTLSATEPCAMQVRFGVGGLHLKPAGQTHHKSLKQLCQAAGIPPWWRRRLPTVFVERTVVSVAARWNTAEAPTLRWQCPPTWGLPPDTAD